MATDCPVCGEEAEHFRREHPADEDDPGDARMEARTTIDVDELCAVEDERWDRVCHNSRLQDAGDTPVPVLGVYYHYFGEADEGT